MRSIHIRKSNNNTTSRAILVKHRTQRKNNPRGGIIARVFICITFVTVGIFTTYQLASANDVVFDLDVSDTVLELSLPVAVNLDLTPGISDGDATFNTANLAISAGTNNPYGYTLTMIVDNTNLTNANFIMASNSNNILLDANSHPIIATLGSGTYTENNFPTNAWGYKFSDSTNYVSVPSTVELISTNSASNSTTTTLNFAAKVNSFQPAGTYSTILNFSTVANVDNSLKCAEDLTGCTWYFNEEVYTESGSWRANISFNSAGSNFDYIYTIRWYDSGQQVLRGSAPGPDVPPPPPGGENHMDYGSTIVCEGVITADYVSNWYDPAYRTITITGGADVTDQTVIDWFYANATLVE